MIKSSTPSTDSSSFEDLSDLIQKQNLQDNAYLDEIFQQLSKLSSEQLYNIRFSLPQADMSSFCGNAIYVDKTQQILNALTQRWVFLARPRRMGKTTTLSTIKLMSSEVYLQSIYPEHKLNSVLSQTYFAQLYGEDQLITEYGLGSPYNISISFKNFQVNPALKAKAQQIISVEATKAQLVMSIETTKAQRDKAIAESKELQEQKQQIEQKFSDNLDYNCICNFLEHKLTNEPDFNIITNYNLIFNELAQQIKLNQQQTSLFLFSISSDAAKLNCHPLDIVKSKLADIATKLANTAEQIPNIDHQIKSINQTISDFDHTIKNLDIELNQTSNEFSKANLKDNSLVNSDKQEELGQLRSNILNNLCKQMLFAVEDTLKSLDGLKAEILANSPDYKKGLDVIEQQTQFAIKRHQQLSLILQNIQNTQQWNTESFTSSVFQILRIFDLKELALFIDEYDACLTDCLDNSIVAEYVRQVMEEFYAKLKDYECSNFINILFVTGVTAYAKTSLFSGANNIHDISYNPSFSDIVGFTEHELKRNFAKIICKHAILNNSHPQEIIDTLADHYDGYYFALPNPNHLILPIFNPLSIVKALINYPLDLENHWTLSATSLSKTVLQSFSQVTKEQLTQAINKALNGGIELIINKNDADIFSKVTFVETQKSAVFLMYQAGYLTIDFENSFHKQYFNNLEMGTKIVVLTPPNLEIRDFLLSELEVLVKDYKEWRFGEKFDQLISHYAQNNLSILDQGRLTLILKAFADYSLKDCEASFNLMLGHYACDINNQSLWENFLRNILFTCISENISASGNNKILHAETEVPVSAGRIDLIVTNENIKSKFIFEFKRVDETNPTNEQIQSSLNVATKQINTHNYTAHTGYKVIAIAGAFFRNSKHFAPNPYSLGYHISLTEVKVVQN